MLLKCIANILSNIVPDIRGIPFTEMLFCRNPLTAVGSRDGTVAIFDTSNLNSSGHSVGTP